MIRIFAIIVAIALMVDFAYSPPLAARKKNSSPSAKGAFCSLCQKLLPYRHCGSRNFVTVAPASYAKSISRQFALRPIATLDTEEAMLLDALERSLNGLLDWGVMQETQE
ncbi:MAG: hypothetical protein JW946_03350 [Candidatus Omnitrophica bacterium]|nr:hypothetical protein [Candidatus Omnitrophota bacterium]